MIRLLRIRMVVLGLVWMRIYRVFQDEDGLDSQDKDKERFGS